MEEDLNDIIIEIEAIEEATSSDETIASAIESIENEIETLISEYTSDFEVE